MFFSVVLLGIGITISTPLRNKKDLAATRSKGRKTIHLLSFSILIIPNKEEKHNV